MESNEEIEYRNKLNVLVNTLSDKMSVLEARDRLMRLKRSRQTDLATAVAVVGTCPDMCPEFERYFREETKQISNFEFDSNGKPDEHRMIKEYRRSGADQEEPLAHELRPVSVLDRTMNYLCTNIMDLLDANSSCGEWYDFVWSRTRSIRKDITQQHLCDEQSVKLTEKCARFHIHCSATLCEQDLKDFDPKINEENLSNCLQSLKDFYYDLSLRDVFCVNEPEFRCYEILLHLNDTAIVRDVQNYRRPIRDSSVVQLAVKVFFAYQSNNYIQFFQLLDQCSYLMACVLHRYFTAVRLKALKIIRKSYTSNSSSIQEYPAQALVDCLGFEDLTELKQFCDDIGLECSHGIVYLIRGQNQNNTIKSKRSLRLIDNKRNVSVGQVINGKPLPANPYKTVAVHHSFDSNGKLKVEAFEALDQQMSANTLNVNHEIESNKPVFGTGVMSQPSVIGSQISSLFSNSNTFFKPQTNTNQLNQSFTKSEPKANNWSHFQPNYNSFPSQTSNANNFNVFIDSRLKTTSEAIQSHKNQVLNNEMQIKSEIHFEIIDNLCESIAIDLIESVSKELLADICSEELQEIRNILEENICFIFSDVLLNTSDDMINEIAIHVIKEEIDLKSERKERIEKICNELTDQLFDTFVVSQIHVICKQVLNTSLDEYIEKQNELIFNQIIDHMIVDMIQDIASEVHMIAVQERESLVQLMKERKAKLLEQKYFNFWKNWFLKRKRLTYLKECFPAAPDWRPNTSKSNPIEWTFSRHSIDDNLNISNERELKANAFLNDSINLVIEEIASQVFDISMTGSQEYFDYIQQKRINRLKNKYFQKWINYCFEKRRKDFRRKAFPAAPDWTPTHAITARIKYSFSDLDSDLKISAKRMRCEGNEQKDSNNEQTIGLNSSTKLKQLLSEEMSDSKAFTKKLSQSLNTTALDQTNGQLFGQTINVINPENENLFDGEEEEEDLKVIEVFETQSDKIERLKRLLSEERDYFSLQNFVQYLADNEDCVQQSDN